MNSESWEFQPRVDKGCKLLDERLGPEWVEKIDLQSLDLQSSCACILGQTSVDIAGTSGSYSLAAQRLFPLGHGQWTVINQDKAEAHGFNVMDNPGNYPALTECWRQTILSRRQESP